MLWFAVTLMLASPPRDDQPQAVRVTTALVAERIALPRVRGPIEVILDSMGARFEIRAGRDSAAVASRVAAHVGSICPKVTLKAGGAELRCRTRRFDAVVVSERGNQYLDIHELRGLPWREGSDGPPPIHYDPFRSGIGSGCPGDNPAGRGECALRDGNKLEAATQFRDALTTPNRQLATLRLGDIALATGDPTTAIGWYRRAGFLGVFGRVARARVCEVEGDCLGSTESVKRIFDSAGLPEAVRADLRLRAVRAEIYQGRFAAAIGLMSDQIRQHGMNSICRDAGEPICRRVVLEAMRHQLGTAATGATTTPPTTATPTLAGSAIVPVVDAEAREKETRALGAVTLEVYLALPGWDRGLLAIELAQSAADLAGRVGAPVFGGNLLAVVAPLVPPALLPDHLLRAAELFLQGGETARARLVVEYASTRLGKRPPTARWSSVQKALAAELLEEEQAAASNVPKVTIDPNAVSQEIAAAQAVSGRSRSVIGKLETEAGASGGKQ